MSALTLVAIVCAVLGIAFFIAGLAALRRGRLLKLAGNFTFGLLLVTVAAALGALAFATRGYQALTREEVALVVRTEPVAAQRFNAHIRFSDGRTTTLSLAGDQFYLDAHILKWKPLVNIFGLHTAYELDRAAGRYSKLEEERRGARTVYALAPARPIDIFELRQRYALLAPLLDAEYGSATFIAADRPRTYEVRVSTTGLLVRPVE